VNIELERLWKEMVIARLSYYPNMCLERLRRATRISVSVASVPVEIRTRHPLNTSLERYLYSNPFDRSGIYRWL
jgi:hypothetical protein